MTAPKPIYLIINADDYGYFPCVSQGILEVARSKALTATGILANSPDLARQLQDLQTVADLDVGLHLNLTFGCPMTTGMAEKLTHWQGQFPNAYTMSGLILSGKISIAQVREEWQAQIAACQGQKLQFLNSHEHIHSLPPLFKLTLELAQEYQIPYIRQTQAEWLTPFRISALLRNTLIQTLSICNQVRVKTATPIFLGLSCSGKLNYDYLARRFATLKAGQCYELMCHPGHFDPQQISNPRLQSYHDWEAELALLQSPKLQELYQQFSIQLCRYQNLASLTL